MTTLTQVSAGDIPAILMHVAQDLNQEETQLLGIPIILHAQGRILILGPSSPPSGSAYVTTDRVACTGVITVVMAPAVYVVLVEVPGFVGFLSPFSSSSSSLLSALPRQGSTLLPL